MITLVLVLVVFGAAADANNAPSVKVRSASDWSVVTITASYWLVVIVKDSDWSGVIIKASDWSL